MLPLQEQHPAFHQYKSILLVWIHLAKIKITLKSSKHLSVIIYTGAIAQNLSADVW
jgi:hypothetical protein